jgi:hypothetical protein
MSLQNIHLRKLLKILYLQGPQRVSALRSDIRGDIRRERGDDEGSGGDFYAPFWRDAKDHVFGITDLREQSGIRIASNGGRTNLYPQLCDGFLVWWNERRRWTNEPFQPADAMKTVFRLAGIDANIKLANILSVRDGQNEDRFVYPYWFPHPPLNDESARLGLWALTQAFASFDSDQFRILDVIRGQTYSLGQNPMRGDEAGIFQRRHAVALLEWQSLRQEYD